MSEKSFLTTFVQPMPNKKLIYSLIWVNRYVNFKGIPILRDIPYLNQLPFIRGLCDIRKIDWPSENKLKLQSVCQKNYSTFIAPNHPELFTDWMLDKEVCAQVAPMTVNWATHDIVNGMGKWMQKFWLANNLLAQIPGQTEVAIDYSLKEAFKGIPVLMHPEGNVLWQSDHINQVYQGMARMALKAWKTKPDRPTVIVPVIWKLVFLKEVSHALNKEINYIEKAMHLPSTIGLPLMQRFSQLHLGILYQQYRYLGFKPVTSLDYFATQKDLIEKILSTLSVYDNLDWKNLSIEEHANNILKAIRHQEKKGVCLDEMVKRKQKIIKILLRTPQSVYKQPYFSQEHIIECLKRIRCDYLRHGRFRDRMHALIPRSIGPRKIIIRVAEPLLINDIMDKYPDFTEADITDLLAKEMTKTLAKINQTLIENNHSYPYANPFLMQQH